MGDVTKRRASELEVMVCEYLNQLRAEGSMNSLYIEENPEMFGAVPYIATIFGIDRPEAKRLVLIWMDNFNEKGEYQWIY